MSLARAPGTVIKDKYEIMESLGEEEKENIYIVRDVKTRGQYVLKEIREKLDNQRIKDTILEELTTTAKNFAKIEKKLDAPKIVDFFLEDESSCLVIEYKKRTVKRLRFYPSLGRTLDKRYIVVRGIAAGGFGVVYLAKDATLPDKYLAIKEMHDQGGNQKIIEDSFRKEARLLSRLNHPSIPAITHFFTADQKLYLVMEYIKGETLKEKLSHLSPDEHFPENEVLKWALTICDVLDYLHNLSPSIIFRDLKPDNIMIDERGELKLIDFGIARIFEGPAGETTSHALLTQGYAPPEQWMGKAEERSDIYSLGATLHQLLTKTHPREQSPGFTPPIKLNPAVSEKMSDIIMKALKLNIEERFRNVKEMKKELEHVQVFRKTEEIIKKAAEFERKTEFMEAVFHYKKALELEKENEDIIIPLASCYEKVGLKDEAEKYLQNILKNSKNLLIREQAIKMLDRLSVEEKIELKEKPPEIEEEKSYTCIISINQNKLRAGEEASIEIKTQKNQRDKIFLITSSRPDDDEIIQPVYNEKTSLIKGKITSRVPGETFITIIDKETGEVKAEKLKIDFLPDLPDSEKSKAEVMGDIMVGANGEESATIAITILDRFENPVPGISVKFFSEREGNIDSFEQPEPTDKEGKTRGEISSAFPGSVTVRVIAEEIELKEKPEIKFVAESTQFFPLPQPEEETKKLTETKRDDEKKKSFPIIAVAIIIILLITGGVAGGIYLHNNQKNKQISEHLEKASLYFSEKQYEKALLEYENILKIQEDNIEARKGLGNIYYMNKDYDGALKEFQRVLGKSPEDEGILLKTALIFKEKKEYERSLEYLEKVLKINSKNNEALKILTENYITLKNYDMALETAGLLSDRGITDKETLYLLGKTYIEKKDYDRAIKSYELILKGDPKNTEAYRGIYLCYAGKEEYEKAIEINKKILEISPEDLPSTSAIGTLYYKLKNYAKALEWITKAMGLKPGKEEKQKLLTMNFDSYLQLARADLKAGKYKEAKEKFKSADNLIPGQKSVKEGLSGCYLQDIEGLMKEEKYREAEKICNEVLKLLSEGEYAEKAKDYLAKIDEALTPEYVEPFHDPGNTGEPPPPPPPDIMDDSGPDIM